MANITDVPLSEDLKIWLHKKAWLR